MKSRDEEDLEKERTEVMAETMASRWSSCMLAFCSLLVQLPPRSASLGDASCYVFVLFVLFFFFHSITAAAQQPAAAESEKIEVHQVLNRKSVSGAQLSRLITPNLSRSI